MNKIILLPIFSLLFIINIFSQPEVLIYNFSSDSSKIIKVKIYPVSMVFNGENEYNLRAKYPIDYGNSRFYYIAGIKTTFSTDPPYYPTKHIEYEIPRSGPYLRINHDANSINAGCDFAFGFGKYIILVWWNNFNGPPSDYVTLEYDAGYRLPPIVNADLSISYVDNNNDPRIQFAWTGDTVTRNTRDIQRKLECWNQYGLGTRFKNFGNFRYGFGSTVCPNYYTIIPQDPRRDCVPEVYPVYQLEQNHLFNYIYTIDDIDYYGASDIGKLTLNLTVEKNVSTPNYLTFRFGQYNYHPVLPSPVIITDGAALKLTKGINGSERTIIFRKYENLNINTPLFIENNSVLELQTSDNPEERSHIIFENYGFGMIRQYGLLMMRKNSKFTLQENSQLILKPLAGVAQYDGTWIEVLNGSTLINCGARFTVYGPRIHVDNNGSRYIISNTCPEDGIPAYETVADSGGVIWLSNQGSLTIDPGCKLTFDGADSYLKAEPGTSIILGEGASIEFRNGAYLDADGCTFTSVNSGEIWNGILLDGAGSQTNIQNCTFNDAAASIEVTNTVCSITGNTFNISNNTSCLYGINAVNETNITIAGNTFNAGSNNSAECLKFFNYDGDGLPGGGGTCLLPECI